ncbi:hypothetical protein Pcinc_006875 [Petrolisthes cinctipes]|nr:hypothetical protein Pcinc_006870 [Petrolisthes cinctipes]KAK3889133.1 hypothetical protein Pcinc_006875 [Petrolisthes cinctipes]
MVDIGEQVTMKEEGVPQRPREYERNASVVGGRLLGQFLCDNELWIFGRAGRIAPSFLRHGRPYARRTSVSVVMWLLGMRDVKGRGPS